MPPKVASPCDGTCYYLLEQCMRCRPGHSDIPKSTNSRFIEHKEAPVPVFSQVWCKALDEAIAIWVRADSKLHLAPGDHDNYKTLEYIEHEAKRHDAFVHVMKTAVKAVEDSPHSDYRQLDMLCRMNNWPMYLHAIPFVATSGLCCVLHGVSRDQQVVFNLSMVHLFHFDAMGMLNLAKAGVRRTILVN